MPQLPASLTIPGPVLATCLIAALVLGVAATLVSALRRGAGNSGGWGQALGGARERQRQQNEQMAALHRAVNDLADKSSTSDKPNE